MLNTIVENFSKPEFSYDLTITTISISVSALLAFCAWLIKDAYEGWLVEIKLLTKIEIYLSRDRAALLQNSESFNAWIDALKDNRAYSFAFRSYRLDNIDLIDVSNTELLNKLNQLSYQLAGFESDTTNTFNDYRSAIQLFSSQNSVDQTLWVQFNSNLRSQLGGLQNNFNEAVNDTEEAIALLRAYKNQKFFSLFRIIRKLSSPIPALSDKSVETELKELRK